MNPLRPFRCKVFQETPKIGKLSPIKGISRILYYTVYNYLCPPGLLAPAPHIQSHPPAAGRQQHHHHPQPSLQGRRQRGLDGVRDVDQGREGQGQWPVRVSGVGAQAQLSQQENSAPSYR